MCFFIRSEREEEKREKKRERKCCGILSKGGRLGAVMNLHWNTTFYSFAAMLNPTTFSVQRKKLGFLAVSRNKFRRLKMRKIEHVREFAARYRFEEATKAYFFGSRACFATPFFRTLLL